jgi:hypothetical protein
LLPLLPAAAMLAVIVYWAFNQGGYESRPTLGASYEPTAWYVGALVIVGLWCATALGLRRIRMSRWAVVACAALLAYTVWSFLSVLWAHDQGAAFLGSVRTLVYLASFATLAMLPWSAWSARVALGSFVAAVGAVAVVIAVKVAATHDPSSLYLDARLVYPLGYYNADAALLTGAAIVAVALGALRNTPAPLRVAGLVVAAVCLQLAVLAQSRGWLFTLPVVLVLALVLVPGRLRLLAAALGPALATAAAAPALAHVYSRATVNGVALAEPRIAQVLHQQGTHAVRAMLLADLLLAIIAGVAVTLDRRIAPGDELRRRANRAGAALAALAVAIGIATGLFAAHGHAVARVEHAWRSFADTSESTSASSANSSRFGSLGSQRADFWRVGVHEWLAHPLAGIGQDNFAAPYLRLGHTRQEPRWVHSIELRLLVHTGLIGALLFALFLLAMLLAALRGRERDGPERAAAGIALLPLIVWLVHGSLDWFWEFPVLSVPVFAFAAAAMSIAPVAAAGRPTVTAPVAAARRRPQPGARSIPAVLRWGVIVAIGLGSLVAVAIPFAAAREVQRATETWSAQPALAYAQLRSAHDLLPFDAQIDAVGGAIALNLEEPLAARDWFGEVQRADGEEWLAPFVLGLLEGERGRRGRARARAQLLRAQTLNPHEQLIEQALRRLPTRYPLTVAEAQTDLSLRASERFGR